MMTVFWDADRNILTDHGSTFTVTYYADLMKIALVTLRKKTSKFESPDILFQQDNAFAHMSSQVLAAILNARFEEFPHPLYSQDLAPSNHYLFPKI